MKDQKLTKMDHVAMDGLLAAILRDFKAGEISSQQVISGVAHIMSAIDQGNHDEARRWFQHGRRLVREMTVQANDKAHLEQTVGTRDSDEPYQVNEPHQVKKPKISRLDNCLMKFFNFLSAI